ncbi:AzlD family protein [Acinetobacter lactucae]|uniref:AzlD family protein n=1 Tax=Acinetobacter lactucae TaxID=1785128 RepID=A0AB35K623_9GAMM|nr:AzlD family protein [Acinetobacter lactucae]MDD9316752.1 AzlD family protein [Acinetobacter lactucae]MDD9320837.1 AzlD family protein [Acinetobacter lactucae]RSO32897.1 AzlD family protein [Acinetobacter lactucae]
MLDSMSFMTIVLMAITTYLTRISGFLLLRNKTLSPRMQYVMESMPGCVLISVIAPVFVSKDPATLVALAITAIAATRLGLLSTVCIGVASAGLLRHLFS